MLRLRSSVSLFTLLYAVSSAAAQGAPPAPLASAQLTCDESALRALAAHPGRVLREGGRVSLVPPAGTREVPGQGAHIEGFTRVLTLSDDNSDLMTLVAFVGEVPHVDERAYQDQRKRMVEGNDRSLVRWIQRQVVDLGGTRAFWIEYFKGDRHHLRLYIPFQGRTLVLHYTYVGEDAGIQRAIEESIASLLVHDCALPPGSALAAEAAEASRSAGGAYPVCEEPELQAHLAAGDPRRGAIADGRISLVPPEGMEELTSVELVQALRRSESRPERMYIGDSAVVWLQIDPGALDVGSPASLASLQRRLGGDRPDEITWVSREVVEQGGARWLRLEYTRPTRRAGGSLMILYATAFQGRTLIAAFGGPPSAREALARSAATLEARDCRVSRP
jgi:hypothetical protein